MKNHVSLIWIRLAALAAFSLMPGMACTYSAAPNAPALGASGGYASVTVWTQPGCRWEVTKTVGWVSSPTFSTGTGTMYMSVGATRTSRSGLVRVYSDYISNEVSLGGGQIGGRSSTTGIIIQPILQFYVTQY